MNKKEVVKKNTKHESTQLWKKNKKEMQTVEKALKGKQRDSKKNQ